MSETAETVDDKIARLAELTERLEELEWEQLRQRTDITLNGLLTFALDAIMVMSPRSRILALNDNARALFQYPQDELIKQPIDMLIPPDEREERRKYREAYFEHPNVRVREVTAQKKDGTIFECASVFIPLSRESFLVTCIVIRERSFGGG